MEKNNMTEQEFRDLLAREGFSAVVAVEREPNGSMDTHTHPFEARVLVTDGEITVVCADGTYLCRSGDTFQLAANVPHTETYGPQGVKYLAGRK
jgi:quercetin dioxygenase-like cupin family protein